TRPLHNCHPPQNRSQSALHPPPTTTLSLSLIPRPPRSTLFPYTTLFRSIRNDETIILDSGTTTAEIARRMRKLDLRSVNVITNALNIAALLIDVPAVRLIMPGGILRRESNSLSGHMAEAALANLQADRLYLGADGVDPE